MAVKTWPTAGKSQQPDGEILTTHEMALELKVSEKTLWLQARLGKVPHFKVGKQFRFLRSQVIEWAKSQESVS